MVHPKFYSLSLKWLMSHVSFISQYYCQRNCISTLHCIFIISVFMMKTYMYLDEFVVVVRSSCETPHIMGEHCTVQTLQMISPCFAWCLVGWLLLIAWVLIPRGGWTWWIGWLIWNQFLNEFNNCSSNLTSTTEDCPLHLLVISVLMSLILVWFSA